MHFKTVRKHLLAFGICLPLCLASICVPCSKPEAAVHVTDPSGDFSGSAVYVLPSCYQAIPGYTWEDIYVILITVIMTNISPDTETPVFTLIQTEDEKNPVLVAGFQKKDGTAQSYTFYSAEEEILYQLHQTDLSILYNDQLDAFWLEEKECWFRVKNHVLYEPRAIDSTAESLSLEWHYPLEHSITSENISSFVHTRLSD